MSRGLKIGFSAAIDCLNKSPITDIDAIIIGTGKGCMVDTEAFIHSIRKYNETALNPTHFIHSTYNQLNGMIALNRKINSYNVTYAHRGFSFEHSLMDAALLLDEGEANNILAGSFDEMTPEHFAVKKIWGYWKQEFIESRELCMSDTEGSIAGEGSSFYLLSSRKTEAPQVAIRAMRTLYNPDAQDIQQNIAAILNEQNLSADDIDIVMSGNNGNKRQQHHGDMFAQQFSHAAFLYFKHLCGEYDTASQFGFWVCTQILLQQEIPEILYCHTDRNRFQKDKIRHILLYNNYFELNQSLILLSI